MKIPFPLAEGVNKIKHMVVGKLKRKAEQRYNISPRELAITLLKKL